MSVAVNPDRLRHEMARRGWDAIDLAKQSHLSPATVSTALAGKPIAARSLALMADAFLRVPANELIDRLVRGDSRDLGYG
jgi:transcriptional regulator with XRE-family HTH domain